MEKLKAKHDHKLTDILKVAIFAIFLMMPFLVYAPNAFYYGFNEHATVETATPTITSEINYTYKYTTNEVIYNDDVLDTTSIINGNKYLLTRNATTSTSTLKIVDYGTGFQFVNFIINDYQYQTTYTSGYNWTVHLRPTASYGTNFIYYPFSTTPGNNIGNYSSQISVGNTCTVYCNQYSSIHLDVLSTYFTFSALPNNLNEIQSATAENTIDYENSTITDAMYKGWEQVWQTPMFSWTNNSILKQGLDNFTGVFGVSDTSYFTNLIVYELIMVAIYIVIDIVLTMFKWLTHLIGER